MNWTRTRIDRVATVNARIGWKALTASEYQADGYAFLSTPNIKSELIDFENVNYISEFRFEESPELKLRPGDVLLAKDGSTLGITNVVHDLPRPATVNGSIAVLRAFDVDPRFLRYSLESSATQDLIESIKGGMGVPHLFQWDIKRLPITLPSLDEQRRVADFLDTETAFIAKIEALRSQQKELLKKRRWSYLHDLIDRAPTDKIPLRRVLHSVTDGPFGSAFSSSDYTEDGTAVVRLGNIGFAEYRSQDQAFIPSDLFKEFRQYNVRAGDILVAGLGDPRNHAGRACVAPDLGPAIVKGKCFRARAIAGKVSAIYIAQMLSSPIGASTLEGRGSTRSMINLEILKSASFPIPSFPKQIAITEEIGSYWQSAQTAIQACDRQLKLLAERRQALITAAVTGEITV